MQVALCCIIALIGRSDLADTKIAELDGYAGQKSVILPNQLAALFLSSLVNALIKRAVHAVFDAVQLWRCTEWI